MRKTVKIIKQADKEIKKFSQDVQTKARAVFDVLERDGKLIEPYGKKLNHDLFEIRIKHKGQWRVLYSYFDKNIIIVLSAFHKKTQQTPIKEINKAKKRLKGYKL